jgi:hypothetical protein
MTKYAKLELIGFGQRHPNFGFEDFSLIQKLKRLNRKHKESCHKGEEKEVANIEKTISSILSDKFLVEFAKESKTQTFELKYEGENIAWDLF